ncbi:hypothetical protein [Bacillus pseudomycoides]|uniref:hypothetical protein n=1 Tax=Bacillus pseudomycoides TaxID=64104 RepID=UPI0026D57CC8
MKQDINEKSKTMVVELYLSGRPVKELNSEYDVSEVTVYKNGSKNILPDLKQMQKEMIRLKEENGILQKVMAICTIK